MYDRRQIAIDTMDPKRKLTLLIGLSVSPATAFAYVDPGSGMLLLQGLIAFVGGIIVFVRNPLATIKRLLERFRRK